MAHLFISYTWQDGDFARTLGQRIRAAGLDVWMDDRPHAGDSWREETDRAIRAAFAVVVVMSGAAKRSEYVTYEWACAWGADVRVIPVLLEPLHLHPRLESLPRRDFSDPDYQPFDALIADLRYIAAEQAAQYTRRDMPYTVQRAFEELEHDRQEARLRALDELAQMQHPSALDALRRAANTAFHDDVRAIAALRVVQRTPENCAAALPWLALLLEDRILAPELDFYGDALDALRDVRDPGAVPDLVAIYADADDAIQQAVNRVIRRLGHDAVPGLMTLLHSGDDAVQQAVTRLLILVGPPAIPALEDALRTEHAAVRFSAAHILGEIGSRDVVPVLVQVLEDADLHLRRLLVHALGRLADPRAIPALIDCLDDRDVQTVAAAVETLGRLNARDAVPALCHVVERPEPTIRLAAVQVLGRLQDPRAVPTLVKALRYNDYQLQLATVEALAQTHSDAAIPALERLLDSDSISLRRAAVQALVASASPDRLPGLRHALSDPDPQIVRSAAAALIPSADRATLRTIPAAVRDLPPDTRIAIIADLRMRGEDAISALLDAATDPDNVVRAAASEGLVQIGGPEVITGLSALLANAPDAGIRFTAEIALERIDADAARRALNRYPMTEHAEHHYTDQAGSAEQYVDPVEPFPSWLRVSLNTHPDDHDNLINDALFSDDPFAADDMLLDWFDDD